MESMSIAITKCGHEWFVDPIAARRSSCPPPGKPFRAVLKKSGKTIEVHSHQSILEAVEAAGIDAPFLCRGGACGQCETNVISCDGSLEHNDHFLTADEKAPGGKIMICVSRLQTAGGRLILDL